MQTSTHPHTFKPTDPSITMPQIPFFKPQQPTRKHHEKPSHETPWKTQLWKWKPNQPFKPKLNHDKSGNKKQQSKHTNRSPALVAPISVLLESESDMTSESKARQWSATKRPMRQRRSSRKESKTWRSKLLSSESGLSQFWQGSKQVREVES